MIRRDRNKASVVLWSVANETPITPARVQFLKTLAAKAREQDPTRLVAAALIVLGVADTWLATYVLIPAFGGRSDYYWAYGVLGSICSEDFGAVTGRIIRAAVERIEP